MNAELESVLKQLKKAKCPEDVFGVLSGDQLKAGKKIFHQLAKVCHADKHTDPKDKKLADGAFQELVKWWDLAQTKIEDKTYGDKKIKATASAPATTITIQSKKAVYAVTGTFRAGDISVLSWAEHATKSGTKRVLVKVVNNPKNNDLLTAEKTALNALNKLKQADHRVPVLIESFLVQDSAGNKRAANVFEPMTDLVSLDEVLTHYGMAPLDPRDVAWMGSRMWANLAVVHSAGFVHGSIHPEHCLICAENHGMVLTDWCYSVKVGEPIKAISPKWKALYPPEVLSKKPAIQATDIYMAAFTLTVMLGGITNTPHNPVFPDSVPLDMQRFLRSCLIPAPHRRPQDADELAGDWKKMLEKSYGKPKFRVFTAPAPAGV